MIYLDNAATTKMLKEGLACYEKYACHSFFNPSAGYSEAFKISKLLNSVRQNIKNKLGVLDGDVIFTSGATESNNLAIIGSRRNGKWEYVFSEGEHPSVYNVAKELASQGCIVHFVGLQKNGQVDYEQLKRVINEKTRLISVMHVNNETGAINNLAIVNNIRKTLSPKALIHVDGVQAFCKINFKLNEYDIDLYSISAHKFHGPKGVGALYVKKVQSLKNILYGGGQESGYRSGTENVPGIMAMDCAMNSISVNANFAKVSLLRKRLLDVLLKEDGVSYISTDSPYIISLRFEGVNGETLMRALESEGVLVSTGSACSSKKAGNRVLESMGVDKEFVKQHIRVSLDSSLSINEIDEACSVIIKKYHEIWENVK